MDVLKSCLQRDPKKRPPISGVGGLLHHPFLRPQGKHAMQLIQAATFGNENMQDIIRQALESAKDEIWNREDFVKELCCVGEVSEANGVK